MRLISRSIAVILALLATVGASTVPAQAAPDSCAMSQDQWLGDYSGTYRFVETAEYRPFVLDVVSGADGALWAEVDHSGDEIDVFRTIEVSLTSGQLLIKTRWYLGAEVGLITRSYKQTWVSCDASGEVAEFGGELDTLGWHYGPVQYDGSFEVSRA